jgi:hypothetical protein
MPQRRPDAVLLTATVVAPHDAMQHSLLIAGLGAQVRVWKVTGRYKVLNLAQLIATQPLQADLYCHCRNVSLRWLDMYLMRWNRRAYQQLIRGVYRKLQQDDTPTSAEQRFRALIGLQAALFTDLPCAVRWSDEFGAEPCPRTAWPVHGC